MPCSWQALDQLVAKEDTHPLPVWSEKEREGGPWGQGRRGAQGGGSQGKRIYMHASIAGMQ